MVLVHHQRRRQHFVIHRTPSRFGKHVPGWIVMVDQPHRQWNTVAEDMNEGIGKRVLILNALLYIVLFCHTIHCRIRRVELLIEPGQSLGLMIRGGVEYGLGIFITGVDKDSVADRAGLKVIVMTCNNHCCLIINFILSAYFI